MKFVELHDHFDQVAEHSDNVSAPLPLRSSSSLTPALAQSMDVVKELCEFFKRRAALEDEYARKLRALCEEGVLSPSLSRSTPFFVFSFCRRSRPRGGK